MADAVKLDVGVDEDLYCPECQYNLRGIGSSRCPECGTAFDRTKLAAGRLPWTHRRQIGTIRAYLATSWLVMTHPHRLAAEATGPASRREALRFRAVTVGLTFVSVLVTAVAWLMYWWPEYQRSGGQCFLRQHAVAGLVAGLTAAPGSWALSLLAALMFLVTATGVAEWFVRPRSAPPQLQDRAAALSQYACASLCLLPAALATASALLWLTVHPGGGALRQHVPQAVFRLATMLAWPLTLGLAAAIPLSCLHTVLVLMRRVAQAGVIRLAAAGAALPILWVLLAAGWFVGLHAVVSFLMLVGRSLRA